MILRRLLPLLLIATLGIPTSSLAQRTLVHAGQVLDPRSSDLESRRTIVVVDGEITDIESGFSSPAPGDTVIDLSGHTVLPGLMDMHVHLASEMSPTNYMEEVTLNATDFAIRSTVYAERTLMAGFTTVRDVGGESTTIVALKRAIEDGWVPGPRIFAATQSLATTGGHGDPTNGLRKNLTPDAGPAMGVVNGIEDAKKAVRQRYKEGADLIKITATGGVLSLAKNGQNPQFTEEEIRAIVETANDYGFHVAAHAHGAEGMKRAIRAGVTTIEHGTYMDEETFELMKEYGTYWVPTISAGKFVGEKAEIDGYFPEVVVPKAAAIGPQIEETFVLGYRAGVPIAFGTDCGVCPHGSNAKEFLYMVEGGMPPLEAIRSATMVPAKILGIEDEVGTIEVGKRADLIAVAGNPLRDVTLLERVDFVMRDGEVYKQPGSVSTVEGAATGGR